jgi:hypothetical protein
MSEDVDLVGEALEGVGSEGSDEVSSFFLRILRLYTYSYGYNIKLFS